MEKRYHSWRKEIPVLSHLGIFRRQMKLWEAVALILGGMIGAGVLGIPYAVAKVGVTIGVVYIITLGLLMIGLNLMVGEIAVRTNQPLQIVGFAGKYLGSWGKIAMSALVYIITFSVLAVYIIGEGDTLSALFGGSSLWWGVGFWLMGSFFLALGIETIKRAEMFLLLGILTVVFLVIAFSAPHLQFQHFIYHNFSNFFFPYGVILFALSGVGAIPEAHALLEKRNINFKKAIIIAGGVGVLIYILFTVVVVGVTGEETTEVATVGLGRTIGQCVFVLGNLFAALAMGGCFLINGLTLRDSLSWDFKFSQRKSVLLVTLIPLVIYLGGLRSFIAAIDLVGGVFCSLQIFLILLIYWRAKSHGDLPAGKYHLHHTALLAILLILALTIGAGYSVLSKF
jgi:amino acid permease